MDVDVAVVGASLAGCTAATLFAQQGASVALIERKPDPDAYKVVCTHQILSTAAPVIERLGLAGELARRGAVRSRPEFWTEYSGWIPAPPESPRAYGVTRMTLDPLMRRAAAEAGAELLLGRTATGLLGDGARVTGVELTRPGGQTERVRAKLVVGADGRTSPVARLARMRARVRPNNRFFYFTYWRGLEPVSDKARFWLLEPTVVAHFPNEDGLSLVAVGPAKSELGAFRADPDAAYRRILERVPEAPDFANAEREPSLIGILDVPNAVRAAVKPGLALVGDAAITTDPVFGAGCSYALRSAEWLVDSAGDLPRYRRKLYREILPHYLQIADFSSGRGIRANEKLFFRAAAKEPSLARLLDDVVARRRTPLAVFDPRFLPALLRR